MEKAFTPVQCVFLSCASTLAQGGGGGGGGGNEPTAIVNPNSNILKERAL